MFSAKRYDAVAELMDLMIRDEALRKQVLAGQRRRLKALATDRVTDALRKCVERMVELGPTE